MPLNTPLLCSFSADNCALHCFNAEKSASQRRMFLQLSRTKPLYATQSVVAPKLLNLFVQWGDKAENNRNEK
ncbi:hypothetical protein O181_017387 [Austropuccinia psidii MF-1]|uniref:Uncharacterized protein n=1 Tax=Austropuccinia psidii MF-1 TaxID=1389203 RepID=A0A9Q3GSI8_9BASI|nr:hypothetical protein [Austropuccinia psidii MF-1]